MHILHHLSDVCMTWDVVKSFSNLLFLPFSPKSSDKCGKLPLSPKQKAMFARWVRPDDITNNPTMIYTVSSFSIKQVSWSQRGMLAAMRLPKKEEDYFFKKKPLNVRELLMALLMLI